MTDINDDVPDAAYEEAEEHLETLDDRLADWADSDGDIETTADGIDIGTITMGISNLISITAHSLLCDAIERLLARPAIPEIAEVRLRQLRSMYHDHDDIKGALDDLDDGPEVNGE